MAVDALSIGISGMNAAAMRMRNSAHNVANGLTADFRSHRTQQVATSGGGTQAFTVVDEEPSPVSFAREFVDQALAQTHFRSSARTIEAALELKGGLLDIRAKLI